MIEIIKTWKYNGTNYCKFNENGKTKYAKAKGEISKCAAGYSQIIFFKYINQDGKFTEVEDAENHVSGNYHARMTVINALAQ